MERYESLGPVGEGSYGTVLKCRHRDSGRLVAIKKFMDSDEDKTVKKIALREIKLLRQLRHDNLVNLLEVWKRRRRWFLVFEFVERTLLDDLEQNSSGLDLNTTRQYLYQILRATNFCHQQNVIHRDIKPENILISQGGVVKLCDFGFARTMASPSEGSVYTDYVATRWYRAPELLVGDIKYGKPVDVWAVGCLLMEMLTGQALFPGDSELDQIFHIVKCFGNLVTHHQELFYRNPVFSGVKLPECSGTVPLQQRFPTVTSTALDLAQRCLEMDPERRSQCSELLEHHLFTHDSFNIRFLEELNAKIQKEHRANSTLPKISKTKTPKQEKDERDEKNCRGKDRKIPESGEEKILKEKTEKMKGKQPSKGSKTTHNVPESYMHKQSKTGGSKGVHTAAQSSIAMKSKPVKATGAEPKKETEISKSSKVLISELSDETKAGASLKKKVTTAAKPEQKCSSSPEPKRDHQKMIKDNMAGNDCSDAEKISHTIRTSTKSEQSQEYAKGWRTANSKVAKLSKHSTADGQNLNSFPKTAVDSAVGRADMTLAPSKITPNTSALQSTPLKTLSSEPSEERPKAFSGTCPAHSTALPKGMSNSVACKSGFSSKTSATGKELIEGNHMPKDNACLVTTTANSSGDNEATRSLSEKTMVPRAPKISEKEDPKDLVFPLSIMSPTKLSTNPTVKTVGSSGGKKGSECRDPESNAKSLKVPKAKQKFAKPESFSNRVRTFKTSKTTCGADTRKKSDSPERHETTTISNAADKTLITPADHKAVTRSSAFNNMDAIDVNELPPPPPCSTPLLLQLSSTSLVSSPSVISTNNFTWGTTFHPGTSNHRYVDKPKHPGGVCGRQAQHFVPSHITGSFTIQAESNLVCERSFMSDQCDLGPSSGIVSKNKSHVHFPDLRSSLLPELRGSEGKHCKSDSKDQGKDKHPGQPFPGSEAQQDYDTDIYSYTSKQME
ncbi:unnamed protein product [Menidia menidia]|uniref:(Atlantic silverside) hypothetical protein n=1 Tax=Menidia menidia TaxID=238744 RepID=A0A8S4B5B1_9TELE|nr:unnamed protein product [Menidia menidia]